MKPIVFAGPSVNTEKVRSILDAEILPPAAQGDVYLAALKRPDAIILIDGYFDCVPSVWHKEILWAMAENIWVFGAASMGALRAAELADFGMVGVGEVFRAFHQGELTDDDEVAIIHGPAEVGFRPLSEAMVNIRATFSFLLHQDAIDPKVANDVISIAKALPYQDRSYPQVLFSLAERGMGRPAIEELSQLIRENSVNQKEKDALDACRVAKGCLDSGVRPRKTRFRLANTDAWHQARRETEQSANGTKNESDDALVLAEATVLGQLSAIEPDAFARYLGDTFLPRDDTSLLESEGLGAQPAGCERRLCDEGLTAAGASSLGARERRYQHWRRVLRGSYRSHLIDQLRLEGRYSKLLHRAEAKRRTLSKLDVDQPIAENELWSWYFEEVVRGPPRALETLAYEMGFRNMQLFRSAVEQEYRYRHSSLYASAKAKVNE